MVKLVPAKEYRLNSTEMYEILNGIIKMEVSALSNEGNSSFIVDFIRILHVLGCSKEKGFVIIPSIFDFIRPIALKYINLIKSEAIILDDL